MGHYIEQTSTIQWHVAVYVACMVSTCLFNIAFAYKDLQGQGEEWSMKTSFPWETCANTLCILRTQRNPVNNSWYSRPYSLGGTSQQRFLVPHLPREVHPSHPILVERFPINPPIHWGSISCEFRPWSLRKPRRISLWQVRHKMTHVWRRRKAKEKESLRNDYRLIWYFILFYAMHVTHVVYCCMS